MDKYTISFNEDIKGWTSFHSWSPDWMMSMNNKFYTFKDGNLYRQFDPDAPRNTFYGVSYPSKLSVMINASPSTIKELQTISIEGNKPWNFDIKAYVTEVDDYIGSSINSTEFTLDEGIWGTYARRNESATQVDSAAVYGIGRVQSLAGTTMIVNGFSYALTNGDKIYNTDLEVVGVVDEHSRVGNITTITLLSIANISVNDFILGGKDPRIEGGHLRGYTMRFDMEILSTSKVELFAVNAGVIKSFM